MFRKLQLLILFVAISLATFAQDWTEVSSDLASGLGIGQISIGMNDGSAVWALAINNDGTINDAFTRSTDGGQTWSAGTFNAGTGLSQIFAIDANTCWAVFNTGADQGLYKTEDGGATWTKKGGAYGGSSFANVIHFFNDNDGFAQGDPVGGYYELYTTTDGGESWTRVPEGDIPAPTSGEYGITGNYSAVGNSIWWGTNQGRVFYSSDKGLTWDASTLPFGTTNVVQPLFKDENVGIAFRSYLDMGIEPELNVTTDGGATWTSVLVNGDMYARWFDYIPGTTGTWVGSSSEPTFEGISFTLDDGATWNDLTIGVPVQAPEFVDNETGWAGTWSDGSSSGILIYNGDPIGGGGGAEIVEDFESYNAGEKLVEQALAQGLDYWTCWSGDGGAGGAEDGTVSAEQVFTGDNSVMCDGTNDFVMLFGDKTAGKYAVDFYMYVPSGFVGYYNLLQAWGPGGTGATWGLEIYFNPGGIAEITAEGVTGIETFSYAYDTWFHVENIINLNMDEAMLMIDGTEILTWEWSVGASGGGINQLAAMDIYAAATNGTPKFFMDDIQLIELEPPVGPPTIGVDPMSFTIDLDAGTSTTETLMISNDGIAPMNWSAFPQYTVGKSLKGAEYNRVVDYKSIEIPELSVTKGLGYPAPANSDLDVTLNYDGENASAVGLTNGGTFEFGAKFPTDMTSPYITMDIFQVQVWVNDIVTNSVVRVYGHGYDDAPGELLAEKEFTSIIGWNNVLLDAPVTITGGDVWVTCEVTHDAGLFPAGNDAGPHTTNGDWFKGGASWVPMHVANPDLDANWNVRAVATGDPMDGWIVLNPANGELNGGDSEDVTVTFDASELSAGTYNANIMVNSNDPATPTAMVPVELTVTGGVALDPPTNLTAELVGTNDAELNWVSPGPAPAFFEGFEGTFPPADWAKISPDGGTGWEQLGVGTTPLPGWTGGEATAPPDGGDFQAFCTWTTGGAASNDQWIVTPMLNVSDGTMLEFYMVCYYDTYADYVEVLISTGSQTDPSDFDVVVAEIDFPVGSTTDWTMYSYDLSQFVSPGTDVYIAFRETVADNLNDGSAISIDNVYVGEGTFLADVEPSNTQSFVGGKDLDYVHVPSNYDLQDRGTDALLGFNVYRDGNKINDDLVTETTYMDVDLGAGTYIYTVTAVYDEGESDPSNEATVEVPVGIGEIPESSFNVYPNPANNLVNISSDVELKSVRITNYTGQVVFSSFATGNELKVNTSDFAAGIYVIQLETEKGKATSKLVIE